jgi:CRP-like cAMP-binding protein
MTITQFSTPSTRPPEGSAAIDLFGGCTRREQRMIARLATPVHFDAGDRIVRQAESARECFVLVAGHARVERDGETIGVCGPGDIVGELALLDRHPRSATVVAHTDVEAVVLGPREFAALLHIPAVARMLTRVLARRLRDTGELVWGRAPAGRSNESNEASMSGAMRRSLKPHTPRDGRN